MEYRYEIQKCEALGCAEIVMTQLDGENVVAEVAIVPGNGANIRRFSVDGIEYLYPAPEPLVDTRHFGIPVLYPFPGMVRNNGFVFDEKRFQLTPNRGDFYRHGYVIEAPFAVSEIEATETFARATLVYALTRENDLYREFPIENHLTLTITLADRALTVHARVENLDVENRLPFGFGLHPYFNLHGERESIQIHVPAQKWVNQAAGTLEDPSHAKYDLRTAQPITGMVIDDVYQGMTPEKPMTLTFGAIGKRLTVEADNAFTHSVIYSPEGASFICLENWTCSHDVHNLYADGKQEAAHLLILASGEAFSGSVRYSVDSVQ